jgi:hypothetical protein
MSHQDRKSKECIVVNHQSLKQAIDVLLPTRVFRGINIRHGSKWRARMLAVVALLWAWSGVPTLVERFFDACKVAQKAYRWLTAGETYQGFIKQLRKWHFELKVACMGELRVLMEQDLFGQWKVAGFVIIAGDGSRVELPRTESNEAAYSPKRKKRGSQQKRRDKTKANRGRRGKQRRRARRQSKESISKKINSPQMWLTLFWHVGTGLPWAWRTGPSDSSERQHLEEMLGELPENSLIAADAGFVGYDFWRAVMDAGHSFVVRAGANVRLLKRLGFAREYDNTVYLWPDAKAKKEQPPLVLRAVWVHNGKHPMCLVTNVLSKTRLSDEQIVEIYKARWGIELFFRTFKQTFGRRKLRSHSAENAQLELDWSLMGLWAICLLAQRELVKAGRDPCQLSPAAAIKAIQEVMRHYRTRPEDASESLTSMFRHALQDDYERHSSKTARNYPRKKQREGTGVAKLINASKAQIVAAREVKAKQSAKQAEFQLTA